MFKNTSPDDFMKVVGRRVAELRRSRHLTQEALGERLGIATKNVQRMEAGRQNLTLRSLVTVANALHVTPVDLLGHSTPPLAARGGVALSLHESLERAGLRLMAENAPRLARAVPVWSLEAAAGRLGGARDVVPLGWVVVPGRGALPGCFVANVRGRSMEPLVLDGSWVLFRTPISGTLEGRVVLVQHRSLADPETGGNYALKKLGAFVRGDDGRLRVRLDSVNCEFPPLWMELGSPDELAAIAELVRVFPS